MIGKVSAFTGSHFRVQNNRLTPDYTFQHIYTHKYSMAKDYVLLPSVLLRIANERN